MVCSGSAEAKAQFGVLADIWHQYLALQLVGVDKAGLWAVNLHPTAACEARLARCCALQVHQQIGVAKNVRPRVYRQFGIGTGFSWVAHLQVVTRLYPLGLLARLGLCRAKLSFGRIDSAAFTLPTTAKGNGKEWCEQPTGGQGLEHATDPQHRLSKSKKIFARTRQPQWWLAARENL